MQDFQRVKYLKANFLLSTYFIFYGISGYLCVWGGGGRVRVCMCKCVLDGVRYSQAFTTIDVWAPIDRIGGNLGILIRGSGRMAGKELIWQ